MPEKLGKIFLYALLILLLNCSKKDKREGDTLGSIVRIDNSVFYKKFSSLVWDNAKEGLPLYKGDYIRTGDKSSTILMIENEKVTINENTLIKIDKKGEQSSREVSVELIILTGNISVESPVHMSKILSVKRFDDGKLILEDVSKLVIKGEVIDSSFQDREGTGKEIELIYPCNNEIVNINNPVFRWSGRVSGVIRIYHDNSEKIDVIVDNEDSKGIDLPSGNYWWEILKKDKVISDKCPFSIKGNVESMKVIKSVSRKVNQGAVNLKDKSEEPVVLLKKSLRGDEDIVKKRLGHIQTIIEQSIKHIKDTKKSIDPEKVKNYAELYRKLDELTALLQDLKVIQESLLIEVIKMDNPSAIVNYLNELEDIERNLKGIEKEIKNIEEIVYKVDVKTIK